MTFLLLALVLPATAAVLCLVLPRLWLRPASNENDAAVHATYKAILFRIVLFILALDVLIVATLGGIEWLWPVAPRIAIVMLGLVVIGVGNLLPRTRPNLAFGIRTERTLSNRRFWMETHRVAGYAAVAVGTVIALSGLLLSGPMVGRVVGTAALVATGVVANSYWKYSRA